MNNIYKILVVLLSIGALSGCSVKSTASKTSSDVGTATSGTSTSTATTGTTTTTTTTTTNTVGGVSCDGVVRDGASRCYYKNIPTIQVMGATPAAVNSGTPYWSSASLIASGTGISPGQFVTDGTFNIRIIPRRSTSTLTPSNPSVPGKTCSTNMHNSTKLFVKIRLRQQSATLGEVATLSASLDVASSVWRFLPPSGSTEPLILEVMDVQADIRCKLPNGTNYCPFADIPLNSPSATYPTECVAFDLQYSTDETYDLPGVQAN